MPTRRHGWARRGDKGPGRMFSAEKGPIAQVLPLSGSAKLDAMNSKSEAVHGKAFSFEDPHWQPSAASGNADAELRVRSAIIGRRCQAPRLPDVDLRLQDRRGRTGLFRLRLRASRATRGNWRRLGLFALQPSQQRNRRGQAFRLRAHRQAARCFHPACRR